MEQKQTPMEIVTMMKLAITITLDKEKEKADWVNASIDSISDAYKQAVAEERKRVREIAEQIIQEERFSGTSYAINKLLFYLDKPTDKE